MAPGAENLPGRAFRSWVKRASPSTRCRFAVMVALATGAVAGDVATPEPSPAATCTASVFPTSSSPAGYVDATAPPIGTPSRSHW